MNTSNNTLWVFYIGMAMFAIGGMLQIIALPASASIHPIFTLDTDTQNLLKNIGILILFLGVTLAMIDIIHFFKDS